MERLIDACLGKFRMEGGTEGAGRLDRYGQAVSLARQNVDACQIANRDGEGKGEILLKFLVYFKADGRSHGE